MLTVLIREAPILLYLQQLHRRSPQAIPYICLGLQRYLVFRLVAIPLKRVGA